MNSPAEIGLFNLALAFIPLIIVVVYLYLWSLRPGHGLYAAARMLLQLLAIGYLLQFVFASGRWTTAVMMAIMIGVSGWIALGVIPERRRKLYLSALFSIISGGGSVLILVVYAVLDTELFTRPRVSIPLAGMIFANSMNALSLATDRFFSTGDASYEQRRNSALNTALIPITNSMLAVGLVSLPGMMTGQILSGVSPLIAAQYQIVVMCMLFGSSGISVIVFLWFLGRQENIGVHPD